MALGLMAAIPVVMWLSQTAALVACGQPLRWRIDARGTPTAVRVTSRIATQGSLLGLIALFPLARGANPLHYYGEMLPWGRPALQFVQGGAAAVLCLCVLYVAWLVSGRVQVDFHHSAKKTRRRLVMLVPTALFGAVVEELLFRGVLVNDLLRHSLLSVSAAVWIGAAVFAGAHYVRSVKRRWTIFGHVVLGILLCLAFVRTGTLWLPMGLHAGGIFAIMGTRPFFWYKGPAWLTGASIFPFAGVIGITGLGILIGFVQHGYGGF